MTPASAEPTYLVRVVRLMLDDGKRAGLDPEELLRGLGVDAALLDNPDDRVPLETFIAIVRGVVDGVNDPTFGLRAGASCSARDGGLVGYTMLHSKSLREALRRLARYGRIMADHNRFEFDESESAVVLVFAMHPALEVIHPLRELNLAWLVAAIRGMTRQDFTPREVRFPYEEPAHVGELRSFFRCSLQFLAPHVAVVLKPSDLDLPVVTSDPTLAGYLDRLANDTVKALGESGTTTGRLRQVLWSKLSEGTPSLSMAAGAMAVSPRTLQRRLRDEGLTFAEALSKLRHDLAVHLLKDRTLATYEVGLLLGYAEPTAFHRAFRRWRGMSPGKFRDALDQPPSPHPA